MTVLSRFFCIVVPFVLLVFVLSPLSTHAQQGYRIVHPPALSGGAADGYINAEEASNSRTIIVRAHHFLCPPSLPSLL